MIPMNILINYEGKLTVSVKYAFFKFKLFPIASKNKRKKEHNQKKQINKKNTKKTKPAFSELVNKLGKEKLLKASKSFFKISISFCKKLFSYILINNLNLNLYIGSDDAAKTALVFGGVSSIVQPLFLAIKNSDNCKCCNLDLKPVFSQQNSYFNLNLDFNIKPFFILVCFIPLFINIIKLVYNIRNS